MILPSDSIAEIRSEVRRWIALISEGRFDEAAAEISTSVEPCSVALLRGAIGRYNRSYREASENDKLLYLPNVSSPYTMDTQDETLVLYSNKESTIIEYDIPIDNAWSDLTAKFRLIKRNERQFELSLVDIRVL